MKNFFLSCKEIRIEPTYPKTYYGSFYLGPFEKGQSLTVANALRRTLLSEISGIAITSIQIDGVLHEYSTLPGLRETVLEILLNFKDIVFRKKINMPITETQVGYLQVRGPGIVRASDLKLPAILQCVDPDQYIATLSEDGALNLSFTIDEGKGFLFLKEPDPIFQDENKKLSNVLSIDSVFTPIKKVNYTIQSYGAKSLYNANEFVILDVWTNGCISPKEALTQALNSLSLLFGQLGQLKHLHFISTNYALVENQKVIKIFTEINQDLNGLEYGLPKIKLFASNFSKADKNDLTTQIQKTTNTNYKKNVHLENKQNRENQTINQLGLPFRILKRLSKSGFLKVTELLQLEYKQLKNMSGLSEQELVLLIENLKQKNLFLKDFKTFV